MRNDETLFYLRCELNCVTVFSLLQNASNLGNYSYNIRILKI